MSVICIMMVTQTMSTNIVTELRSVKSEQQ